MLSRCFLYTFFTLAAGSLFAQKDSGKIKFSGYLETYYTYDFNRPQNHTRPDFLYSHNRHNEFNLNLGFLKGSFSSERLRANLAFAAGTYMNANLASEPGVLKNIFEANLGVKLSARKNWWLDAGVLPSHIGFESAVSKDCWTLTRSMLADNSPYYETGVKLSYTSQNNKWTAAMLILNGWQRIQRLEGNQSLGFGHQLVFKPTDKTSINSSSFIGNDQPDSNRQMRYFHNLFGQFELTEKWAFVVGFDMGAQQKSKGSKQFNSWYSPVLISRFQLHPKWKLAVRGEYYSDKNKVIVDTQTANGFSAIGYSMNIDYAPFEQVSCRLEIRQLRSNDYLFYNGRKSTRDNEFLTISTAISF
ncbi:porin [Flavihumibacter cheonanensis]|uniref:porin n=1 Tax=Flavihumibacter cheonanensis TaxID=1442385 RepID=UPI001EF8CCCC|nr:porin [Flavihumibacter cheonanensis]MCG7753342.1 porin [Flavihumibacter cheonanensis]